MRARGRRPGRFFFVDRDGSEPGTIFSRARRTRVLALIACSSAFRSWCLTSVANYARITSLAFPPPRPPPIEPHRPRSRLETPQELPTHHTRSTTGYTVSLPIAASRRCAEPPRRPAGAGPGPVSRVAFGMPSESLSWTPDPIHASLLARRAALCARMHCLF